MNGFSKLLRCWENQTGLYFGLVSQEQRMRVQQSLARRVITWSTKKSTCFVPIHILCPTPTASLLTMAVHMVALAKLNLLAGGHSSWFLSSLLCSFVLKLPFATLMPASFSDMASCLRFLLFQLNRIWFHDDTPMQRNRRWRRSLLLLQDRFTINDRSRIQSDMETMNAIATLAL